MNRKRRNELIGGLAPALIVALVVAWELSANVLIQYYQFNQPVSSHGWGEVKSTVSTSHLPKSAEGLGPPYAFLFSFRPFDANTEGGTVHLNSLKLENEATGEVIVTASPNLSETFPQHVGGIRAYADYGNENFRPTIEMDHVPHLLTLGYTIRIGENEFDETATLRFDPV